MSTSSNMRLQPFLSLYTQINPEWIEDLNVKSGTIRLLEENIQEGLHRRSIENAFMDKTSKHRQ